MRTSLLYSSVFLLTCALTACRAPMQTPAPLVQPPASSTPLGIVTVQVSGLGDATPLVQTSFTPSSRTLSAQSFTLFNPNTPGNTVSFSRATVSFTDEVSSGATTRHLTTVLDIQNNSSNAFDNLTLVALNFPGVSEGGSAVGQLKNASDALISTQAQTARAFIPTHSMARGLGKMTVQPDLAHLQVFRPAEVAQVQNAFDSAFPGVVGETLLGYGYVAQNLSGGRSILASSCAPTPDCNRGQVALGYKFARTALSRAQEPWSFTLTFALTNDSTRTLTQSLEEQADNTAVADRASRTGAGGVRTLAASTYSGSNKLEVGGARIAAPVLPELANSVWLGTEPALTPTSTPGMSAWSDPATWGGSVPAPGSSVTIAADQHIILDSSVQLKNLTVLGTLEFAEKDLELSADYIMLHGTLRIGSATKPFQNKATITLSGNDSENIMGMGSRGILVMGGKLELYGKAPLKAWTQLSDHASAGSSSLKLLEDTGWKAGDQIVVAPTDFYNGTFMNSVETEQLELGAVLGSTVNLSTPLQKARWGKLQYATEGGMSLSAGTLNLPSTTGRNTYGSTIPTVLDERAEVGNLTRNIVIQGADDPLWQNSGFGAQVMVMDRSSNLQMDGVELRRMGQAGKFGRYPIHFHNLSYSSSGAELGDVNYRVQNSSVWNSSQRCMVIHGSSGITLKDNLCYDIKGHAIFLEDAVERRNVLEGNLVLKVRRPATTQVLLKHEGEEGFGGTSSGFWIVNPDNTLRGNVAADIIGHGYWLAFPESTLGVNNKVKLNAYVNDTGATVGARPSNLPFGVFENNVAHSVQDSGVFIDAVPTDVRDSSGNVAGETDGNKYIPMDGGKDWGYDFDKWQRFTLKSVTVYKTGAYWGGGGGIWNRNSSPNFLEWVSADHQGRAFAGAGDFGLIARSLVIGKSLNVGVPRYSTQPLAALASYHSTFDMTQNVILEFPFVEGADNNAAGVFMTDDYYITAVDKGLKRNPDNKLINSSPGRRVQPFLSENWTLAGALWDANGYWGPAGNYWVYDQPFFTSGTTCQTVQPAGKNGSSCAGPYYGIGDFYTNFDTDRYSFKHPIEATRVSATGSSIGVWSVGDGNTAPKLGNMRHFAGLKNGRYILRFPQRNGSGGYEIPTLFSGRVDNFLSSSDSMLLGVAFTGGQTPIIKLEGTERRDINTVGANLNAVQSDATGKTYWQDKPGNLVWVKLMGGFTAYTGNPDPNANENLYQSMVLEIK